MGCRKDFLRDLSENGDSSLADTARANGDERFFCLKADLKDLICDRVINGLGQGLLGGLVSTESLKPFPQEEKKVRSQQRPKRGSSQLCGVRVEGLFHSILTGKFEQVHRCLPAYPLRLRRSS